MDSVVIITMLLSGEILQSVAACETGIEAAK